MKKLTKFEKGGSTFELAVFIVCLISALLAMQVYVTRSIQGRLRATADSIGEQYAPKNTELDITLSINSNSKTMVETFEKDGVTTTTTTATSSESQLRSGTERVGPLP